MKTNANELDIIFREDALEKIKAMNCSLVVKVENDILVIEKDTIDNSIVDERLELLESTNVSGENPFSNTFKECNPIMSLKEWEDIVEEKE